MKKLAPRFWWDDERPDPAMLGSAHSVSGEPVTDELEKFYRAVEDATGQDLRPRKRRIGF